MNRLIERCAMLDIHKSQITACVRVPDGHGGRRQELAEFSTTTAGLITLADWLRSHAVTVVGMESTGVYWRAVFYLLEDEFDCRLYNARHLRHVPGRKSDVQDAEWGCQLVEHGLVRASFVPDRSLRELLELLDTIPGIDRRAAELILSEIGPDMSRFPTEHHLASWGGMCPGQRESGGKKHSSQTRKGSKWLRGTLTESAKAVVRTKGTYLSARYHRIKSRRGHAKATIATAHKILTAAYHVLDRGVPYDELGEEFFYRRDTENTERYRRRLIRQLERLGHKVTLEPLEDAA